MWTSAALLAGLVLTAASLPREADRYFQASEDFLRRQLQVMQMFLWQYDAQMYEPFAAILESYDLKDNLAHFKEDPEPARRLLALCEEGSLFPADKVFTLFESQPWVEARLLFDVFLGAADLDTFIKTAVWTRQRVNRGLFYHVFRTALAARPDSRDFYCPAAYETYPQGFLDERVIQRAVDAKIRALQTGDLRRVVVAANCSGRWDAGRDPEGALCYFREDVGLNTLSAEFHRQLPAWLNSSEHGSALPDRKGELFLHFHRQLLARYHLERLGNNLGETPHLREDMSLVGYYPHLRHSTGEQVTPRQPFSKIRDTERLTLSEYKDYVKRIQEAINVGYVIAENGTQVSLHGERGWNILGEMLAFVGDNINYNYYGSIYYKEMYLLGAGNEKRAPSALLHPETALRDPLYYQGLRTFFKEYYYKYLETLPKHTFDDVACSGLTIVNVDVDKLVTYFDNFDIDLFHVTGKGFKLEDNTLEVSARLERLNHQPFSYRVALTSDKDTDVIVKVYLTPKYDIHSRTLPMNKRIFYAFEIDRFPAKVTAGKNIIQRKSQNSTVAVGDPPTFKTMWKKVQDSLAGKDTLVMDKFARPYGFPQRLLLPKGTRAGLPVQLVVAVFPRQEADPTDPAAYHLDSFPLLGAGYDVKFPDRRPMSFPADRLYRSEYDARVPNIFTKEVRIFHKNIDEITAGTR
ncbi:hexamerin-like [Bacillus rossius redtenbacheri]|uniref:hexamerin-like n=1 Tax=Bacillus rossius redtenbacheri TaxID=93214 RepID=UPI002FDE5EE8